MVLEDEQNCVPVLQECLHWLKCGRTVWLCDSRRRFNFAAPDADAPDPIAVLPDDDAHVDDEGDQD